MREYDFGGNESMDDLEVDDIDLDMDDPDLFEKLHIDKKGDDKIKRKLDLDVDL